MLFAAFMSSTPGNIVTSVEPETESVHLEQESTKGGIQAEPKAEPHPEWSTAVEKWGAAWGLHQFGLGSLFGIIGLFALLAFFKLLKKQQRQPTEENLTGCAKPDRSIRFIKVFVLMCGCLPFQGPCS